MHPPSTHDGPPDAPPVSTRRRTGGRLRFVPEHLEYFEERLLAAVLHVIVLRGGMTDRERRSVMERLAAIPDGEERVLLATGRYIGEGFDDSRLDTLFLAMPVSWKGTLVQYAGRLHRLHPGKREVRIVDYVDGRVPVLARMFDKRLRGYRAIGYAKGEVPPGPGKSEGTEAGTGEGEWKSSWQQ